MSDFQQPQATIVAIPGLEEDEVAAAAAAAVAAIDLPDTSNDAALAALLAAEEEGGGDEDEGGTCSNKHGPIPHYSVATLSAPWQYDVLHLVCAQCGDHFHPLLNRRHHCRLCGHIFCHSCSQQKALIPPSRIVLHPVSGKKSKPRPLSNEHVSFTPDPDPDRMLTYIASATTESSASGSAGSAGNEHHDGDGGGGEQLLYGKGLEERFQLAREPLRVCRACYRELQSFQEELRLHNSHAMRYNHVDPTDVRRLFNSPVAHTLGHEIRKAAYTLNNLLPQPKRRSGPLLSYHHSDYNDYNSNYTNNNNNNVSWQSELQQCQDQCANVSPNLGDWDGVQIPTPLLAQAKGVAILTVVKGGFGLAGIEFGTGLVVARLPPSDDTNDNHNFRWSAPSAIGTAGVSWGALIGAQVSDHVFLLMSDAAVALLYSNTASVQLGADIGIAIGPLGRAVEGDWGVGVLGQHDNNHDNGPSSTTTAPIYTYSLSKGLYAGISLDGKIIVTRPRVNEAFYGWPVTAREILAGAVPTPPAAQPLYEALHRCHVYASSSSSTTATHASTTTTAAAPIRHQGHTITVSSSSLLAEGSSHSQSNEPSYTLEYGEVPPGTRLPTTTSTTTSVGMEKSPPPPPLQSPPPAQSVSAVLEGVGHSP